MSLVDHRNMVGYAHNQFHVVLHQQHRYTGILYPDNELRQILRLACIQASSGLIEHKKFRPRCQSPGQFKDPLITEGQAAGRRG